MRVQLVTKQVMLIFNGFSSSPVAPLVFLAAEGYEVVLARNEQEVQDELVTDSKPDLVLLEMGQHARESLQIIQSAQPRIPVIVMTEPGLLNLALEIKKEFGAWEVILRPLDFEFLRELLQQALGGNPKAA
jgi:DNA-binding NtrC family response regulator